MLSDLIAPLRQIALEDPGRVALHAQGRAPATFGGLVAGIAASVAALQAAGVTSAARVATVLPNGPETATAILSIASFATCVPVNAAYPPTEMLRHLADAGVSHVVVSAGDAATQAVAIELGLGLLELSPDLAAPAGAFRLAVLRHRVGLDNAVPDDGGRVALVLHTSGSTGSPKRVPLSVANLSAATQSVRRSLALSPADICFNMMPMFHIGALVDLMLAPLSAGGSTAFAATISSAEFFAGSRIFAPTWFQAVPTVLRDILAYGANADERAAVGRLRLVRAVSQPLPSSLQADFEERFGVPVVPIFGMTETAGLIASMPLDQSKPGSVGVAFGTRLRIADVHGNEMPRGRHGEVLVEGPNLMAGYEGMPERRAEHFLGGWFRTGDEGYLDDENFLFLTGRLKEVINRGGEKISPAEIDLILAGHPAIREAAAFPLPHPTLGEELGVAVVRAPGATLEAGDVIAFLRAELAEFKVPRQVLFLPALPRLPSGKLDRGALPALAGAAQPKLRTLPQTPLARSIAALWREVLEIDDVAMEDDFFDRGGDSLRATTLAMLLEQRFERQLPSADLFDVPTLAQMEQVVAREARQGEAGHGLDPAIYASLQRIMAGWQGKRLPGALIVGRNTLGTKTPFFWVPQSLHGFESLARCLDPERPLYAMTSLSRTKLKTRENTLQLARHYAGEILAIQPEGPFLVGGFCQGGVVAFHIAKALRSMGHEVALLCMQDRLVSEPYDGEVALFYGKRGVYCAYDMNHDPSLLWRKYYAGRVSLLGSDADHTELHNSPYVEFFARQLEAEFARVQAGRVGVRDGAPPLQPIDAASIRYKIRGRVPMLLRQGSVHSLRLRLTNTGTGAWAETARSGLVVAVRWRVFPGPFDYCIDGRAEIPDVAPRQSVEIEMPLRVPMRGLPMLLELELKEDGMTSGDYIPVAGLRSLVLPLPPSAADFAPSPG